MLTCVCVLTGTVSGLRALLSWASRSSRGCWDWKKTRHTQRNKHTHAQRLKLMNSTDAQISQKHTWTHIQQIWFYWLTNWSLLINGYEQSVIKKSQKFLFYSNTSLKSIPEPSPVPSHTQMRQFRGQTRYFILRSILTAIKKEIIRIKSRVSFNYSRITLIKQDKSHPRELRKGRGVSVGNLAGQIFHKRAESHISLFSG